MNIFESAMLICFGFAWPFSIYKSAVSRQTAGKSLPFLIVLQAGYVAGILFKLTEYWEELRTGAEADVSVNLYLYSLNLIMITVDECLFLRNRRLERGGRGSGGAKPY
jgi:hypothetical protein